MTNAKTGIKLILIFMAMLSMLITACSTPVLSEETSSDEKVRSEISDTGGNLFYFDYQEIELLVTQSIGMDIKSVNIFLDDYDEILINGQLVNTSSENLTDTEITLDILDSEDKMIFSQIIPAEVDYIQRSKRYPFTLVYNDKKNYIYIDSIRLGVNYKTYNNEFLGNPLVRELRHYYEDNRFIVEGLLVNIGRKKAEELKVLATFFDSRDRVVFIRECYISRDSLKPLGQQEYVLEINMENGLIEFTHYDIEVFYTDAI